MSSWPQKAIYWIFVYLAWTYMKSFGEMPIHSLLTNLVHISAYISVYLVLKQLIPRFFDQGKWLAFVSALIVATSIILLVWYVALNILCQYIELYYSTIPTSLGSFLLEAVQMYVPGMILLAWESYHDQEKEARRLHQLEKENLENELNYLKAQLNPQFLLNTLTNLKTFIENKSTKAPEMILKLSAMLDYVLYRSDRDSVPIKEEIQAIRDFTELEKLRLGDRLELSIQVNVDEQRNIAPLVLLSLIENNIKESVINASEQLKLTIDILTSEKSTNCLVQLSTSDKPATTNWTDLKRQLDISYPDKYSLSQQVQNNCITTSLKLLTAYG